MDEEGLTVVVMEARPRLGGKMRVGRRVVDRVRVRVRVGGADENKKEGEKKSGPRQLHYGPQKALYGQADRAGRDRERESEGRGRDEL
jgi:hypothetical protein